jgi:hypothetical protein
MSHTARALHPCTYCHQPVLWAITAAGKRQPLNPEPDELGNVVAHRDVHGTWRCRVPNDREPQQGYEKRLMPHAATCLYGPKAVTQDRLPVGVVSLAAQRRARRPRRR